MNYQKTFYVYPKLIINYSKILNYSLFIIKYQMHFAVDVILLKLEIFESVNPSILANIIADAFTMKRFDSCFKIKFFN